MQKIVGVKRSDDKNIYYFIQTEELKVGDKVVVEFDEFLTLGTICKIGVNLDESKALELNKIIRKATEQDIKKFDTLKAKAKDNLVSIKSKSLELGLMMKFVGAEYSLDNSKIMIVFSSEDRVDFRQFLKELASMLKIRIELKQIGQRDEIKVCGGVGPCGEPCCCTRFLDDFEHVTVKMAKTQGLSLSPTKINGICGRLMCCLGYEAEFYEETLKKMPKVGSEIMSPNGKGVVVYNDILRERVSVKRQAESDSFVVEDFTLEEIVTGKRIPKPELVNEKPEVEQQSTKNNDVIEKKDLEIQPDKINNEKKEQKNAQNNQNVGENKAKKPFNKNRHHKNKWHNKPEQKN